MLSCDAFVQESTGHDYLSATSRASDMLVLPLRRLLLHTESTIQMTPLH